eukprot:SAG31_NODE_1522_length_8012_cov_6.903336_8_plen_284_part_00
MLQLGTETATHTYSRGADAAARDFGPSLRGILVPPSALAQKRPSTPDHFQPQHLSSPTSEGSHNGFHHGGGSIGAAGPALPSGLMDVVVLRRQFDGNSGVSLRSTACSFGAQDARPATSDGRPGGDRPGSVGFVRQGPMVSLGLRADAPHDRSRRDSGSGVSGSTTALKNRLAQMRQMLEEAKRRIRVLEDARRNDQKLYAEEMQMQADMIRADAAAEIRRLKERTKINSGVFTRLKDLSATEKQDEVNSVMRATVGVPPRICCPLLIHGLFVIIFRTSFCVA